MNWREEAWQGFRPPYDDEPADLRRNILDELDDHLACALREESARHADPESAWRAVLERFGHPRRLARRLYLDAMKERIMKDRAMFLGVLVLAAVAIVATVFSWMALQETQKTNQAMLQMVEGMSVRMGSGASSAPPTDLASVTIRVVKGSKDGEPVPGMAVTLEGCFFTGDKGERLEFRTDEKGIVKFGPMRPGRYQLNIFDGALNSKLWKRLILFGGRNQEETIIYPQLADAAVHLSMELPADLKKVPLLFRLRLGATVGEFETGRWEKIYPVWVDVAGDGKLYNYLFEPVVSASPGQGSALSGAAGSGGFQPVGASSRPGTSFRGRAVVLQKTPPLEKFVLPTMDYRLGGISICLDRVDEKQEGKEAEEIVYNLIFDYEYHFTNQPFFRVRPDVANEWKIVLPDGLLDRIRGNLAQIEEKKKAEAEEGSGNAKKTGGDAIESERAGEIPFRP